MKTRLITKQNGTGNRWIEEVSQLDDDISDTKKELARGKGMKERHARLDARKAYKMRLAYQIKMALKD